MPYLIHYLSHARARSRGPKSNRMTPGIRAMTRRPVVWTVAPGRNATWGSWLVGQQGCTVCYRSQNARAQVFHFIITTTTTTTQRKKRQINQGKLYTPRFCASIRFAVQVARTQRRPHRRRCRRNSRAAALYMCVHTSLYNNHTRTHNLDVCVHCCGPCTRARTVAAKVCAHVTAPRVVVGQQRDDELRELRAPLVFCAVRACLQFEGSTVLCSRRWCGVVVVGGCVGFVDVSSLMAFAPQNNTIYTY